MTNKEVWSRLCNKYDDPPLIEFWQEIYEEVHYYIEVGTSEEAEQKYKSLREELLKSSAIKIKQQLQDYVVCPIDEDGRKAAPEETNSKVTKEEFIFPNGGKITVNLE